MKSFDLPFDGTDLIISQHNTSLGYDASDSLTSGDFNSALGSLALNANTTGNNNVAMGYRSLRDNTTGSNNTAVGYEALQNNTSGSSNIALGYRAMRDNTTGINNAAFSRDSLRSNTTGNNNVAAGNAALLSNTTGDNNTAIGYDSGYYITTGSNNSILGAFDGNQGGLDIRTSNNNIVLSDGSGNPRGVFDSSGNFMVGAVTSTAQGVTIYGDGVNAFYGKCTGTTNQWITRDGLGAGVGTIATINSDGTAVGSITVTASGTAYNITSDYRLKENIVDLTGATDRLKQIPVHRFNFINDPDNTVDGFLAHEVQAIVPEAVHGTKDEVDEDGEPVYQAMDASKLVPLLVATIKELEARIAAIENA